MRSLFPCKNIVCAVALAVSAASAGATVVDYTFQDHKFNGSFSGIDADADGFLRLNELTAFSFDNTTALTVAGLFDFGSYEIATNTWNADASGWGIPNYAYFSWDGGASSANRDNVVGLVTIQASAVPEPMSLALIGVGLLGIRTARRRQSGRRPG